MSSAPLPAVTLIIEWENAIDVEDAWTARAMGALEREIRAVAPRMAARPRITYLYDRNAVAEGTIERVLDSVAPGLRKDADVEVVPPVGASGPARGSAGAGALEEGHSTGVFLEEEVQVAVASRDLPLPTPKTLPKMRSLPTLTPSMMRILNMTWLLSLDLR